MGPNSTSPDTTAAAAAALGCLVYFGSTKMLNNAAMIFYSLAYMLYLFQQCMPYDWSALLIG